MSDQNQNNEKTDKWLKTVNMVNMLFKYRELELANLKSDDPKEVELMLEFDEHLGKTIEIGIKLIEKRAEFARSIDGKD